VSLIILYQITFIKWFCFNWTAN